MCISYGDDFEYAAQKIVGSTVRYQGEPVFVNYINPENGYCEFNYYNGRGGECYVLDLDLEPLPLGYINDNQQAVFVTRVPARHYRQGLRDHTCYALQRNRRTRLRFNRSIISTVKGMYPSFEDCLESVYNMEWSSRAFTRNFSVFHKSRNNVLNPALYVEYKGREVGTIDTKKSVINLSDKFLFLKESVEEVINA